MRKTLLKVLLLTTISFAGVGELKWKFKTPDAPTAPAIGHDGTIYVAANDDLFALTPDGKRLWRIVPSNSRTSGFGNPAVGPDGTIYIGHGDGNLYAISAEGKLRWKFKTDGYLWDSSVAISSDTTIYIGSYDSYLYALTPKGDLKWKFKAWDSIHGAPAIGADGTIYFGSRDSYFRAISPQGKLKWKFKCKTQILTSPAISGDGTVIFSDNGGNTYAVTPAGEEKWQTQALKWDVWSLSPVIGADGTIYSGNAMSTFYAFNPNGTIKWKYSSTELGNQFGVTAAIGADALVYSGTERLYVLTESGYIEWMYSFSWRKPKTGFCPGIGKDGTVYFGNEVDGGYFYAVEGTSPGLADAPWPCLGGNAQRTGQYSWHPTKLVVEKACAISGYHLHQNYPNPFNPVTRISFDLPKAEHVTIEIYDLQGKKIKTLLDEQKNTGYHSVQFRINNGDHQLPSGIYMYTMRTKSFYERKKLTIVK